MRTCPNCSTINSDDTLNCGVCGAGLSSTASLTLEAAESIARDEARNRGPLLIPRGNSIKVGLVSVLSGVGLIVTGVIVFGLVSSLWPILIIIPGMVLIFAGLDDLAQTFRRPLYGSRFWRLRGGTMSMRRESEREAAEEKKIESGEAD